ncbi:ABC-type transport system involved in multi-copper enzyme maturation permease subunit [Paenibacillus sp. PastF-3]|uniref:ABC transporter permease subunit n=1 Tax=Paenibacillus sp. PastF-3 TaxID=2940626 RepID=UPI00247397F0|nr:ABC transporter permease subunit [Paenibacillus sp. PastF-3]MDH6368474.1 ABC-type transport system involved in multi-copper enzyme maturation permease subunit [Paenibacillus sp. PastF-3]
MRIIMVMTWKELMRKRVMVLTLLMTVVFLIGFWFIAGTIGQSSMSHGSNFPSGEELLIRFTNGLFILSFGFFFGAFVIAFLAIFSSFSAISGEAEQGVMQALLPRAIPRWKWYAGRWLGYVTLGIGYALILFISILLITQAHAAIPRDGLALFKSFLLFSSIVPLLITVSMLGSGFFSALGNGVFMTMLYGAGWLGGMIDKVSSTLLSEPEALSTLNNMTGIMSLLMPVDGLQRRMTAELFSINEMNGMFNASNSLFGLDNLTSVPSNTFIVYAIFYTLLALLIGLYRFQRKDL